METLTSCNTCIHEKVCSHKQEYKEMKDKIKSNFKNSSMIFHLSLYCQEYAIIGSCVQRIDT